MSMFTCPHCCSPVSSANGYCWYCRRIVTRRDPLLLVIFTVLVIWLTILIWQGRAHAQERPKITPAQAAEILRVAPGLANWSNRPEAVPLGPTSASTGARWPLGGPWSLPPWLLRVPNWYGASQGVPRYWAWPLGDRTAYPPTYRLNSPGRGMARRSQY